VLLRRSLALTLLVAAVLAGACLERVGYRCETDEQCDLDGLEGRCQISGYCAYADAECPSGLRYEPDADALADRCVPRTGDESSSGSSSDSSGGSGSDSVSASSSESDGASSSESG